MSDLWFPESTYEAIRNAAKALHARYRDVMPYEDIEQEAMLYAHTHTAQINDRMENPGFVYRHVYDRTHRVIQRELKRQDREVPTEHPWGVYEGVYDESAEKGWRPHV